MLNTKKVRDLLVPISDLQGGFKNERSKKVV